jgi:hypothetical protein
VTTPELRTAPAAQKPCELYRHHEPVVVQTAGHHTAPVYLQNRVFGRIEIPTLKWLCPNCHTAVHETIDWMLGEGRRPDPMPGRNVLVEARRTVDWYHQAIAEAAEESA